MQNSLSKSKSVKLLTFYAVLTFLASAAVTNALNCYVCSYLEGHSNKNCVSNASSVPVLNCTKKYCLTMRQEDIRNASKVISFVRDCQDKPQMSNGVKTDSSFRTYYNACQQDLCNGHDGRGQNTLGQGNTNTTGPGSTNHNGLVPGKSRASGLRDHTWLLVAGIAISWLVNAPPPPHAHGQHN